MNSPDQALCAAYKRSARLVLSRAREARTGQFQDPLAAYYQTGQMRTRLHALNLASARHYTALALYFHARQH